MTPFLDLWSYESHTGTSWPVCKAQTFETPSNTKDEISNSLSSLQHSRLFRTSLTSTTWMSTEFHKKLTKIGYRPHRGWHYLVSTNCKEISTPVPAGRKQSCWSFPPWCRRWHPPGGRYIWWSDWFGINMNQPKLKLEVEKIGSSGVAVGDDGALGSWHTPRNFWATNPNHITQPSLGVLHLFPPNAIGDRPRLLERFECWG